MATISSVNSQAAEDGSAILIKWEALVTGSLDGIKVSVAKWADKTVQAIGTFDTATITMQGSNDGTNWFTLTDFSGTDVAFTAAGGAAIAEAPFYIRPLVSSVGGSTDIDVLLLCRTNNILRN